MKPTTNTPGQLWPVVGPVGHCHVCVEIPHSIQLSTSKPELAAESAEEDSTSSRGGCSCITKRH